MHGKVIVVLTTVVLALSTAAQNLSIPQTGVEFGDFPIGELITRTLDIKNTGNITVRVSQVKACCGATAELSSMVIAPNSSARLSVSFKAKTPGLFSKAVHLYCNDPSSSVIEIPVNGRAIERGGESPLVGLAVPSIVLAGFVDGFNPCAFSVVIFLVGALAAGGKLGRIRLLGGFAFCVGSFATYLLIGLGLMRALQMANGLKFVGDLITALLALSLLVLSFLSIRDAFRFRKTGEAASISLRLPKAAHRIVHRIAKASWNSPLIVLSGVGCGVLITLVDSICTGQIYVPVVALLSRDPVAWRSFALMVVYNVAFIAPLLMVFAISAAGVKSARLARWSRANVFPAKLGMGIVFLILFALIIANTAKELWL